MAFKFKKVLITGANGQLAHSFKTILADFKDVEILLLGKDELDIEQEQSIQNCFEKHADIDLCINCAAYTKVDLAEKEIDQCFRINAKAPGYLAKSCALNDALIVHFSSDYVYDNGATIPIHEKDKTTPKSVYAQSKLAGEKEVQLNNVKHFIFRTSWLYGTTGNNFVKTMHRLGHSNSTLTIVNDQIGAPTFTLDLALAVIEILSTDINLKKSVFGIYNFSNNGVTNWHAFAEEIFRLAELKVQCETISTEEYGAPAPRPKYSVLSHQKLINTFNIRPRAWQIALKDCMGQAGLLSN